MADDEGPVKVKMLQHVGGPRYDGRAWPPPGESFEVPAWEAEELTAKDDHHDYPLAVRVGARDPRPSAAEVPGRGEPEGTARRLAEEAGDPGAAARDADAEGQRTATEGQAEGGISVDPAAAKPRSRRQAATKQGEQE